MGAEHETVTQFYRTFEGRDDAWGGDEGRAIWQPVTRPLVERHLTGQQGIGIYPIRQRATEADPLMVRWGCCDIDTGDWTEAWRLGYALEGMGMLPWIERSRSKGWHIWVFADGWVPAWQMRRTLKVAYSAIGLPAREANPKSEKLRPNQLGNYVRLPYKGWFTAGNKPHRQVMMKNFDRHQDGTVMDIDEFLETPKGVAPPLIAKWASKWHEPKREVKVDPQKMLTDGALQLLAANMKPSTREVWSGGPKHADRSSTLQALAFAFRAQGYSPQECFQLIAAADLAWGKYHERPDFEGYISDIVERAYT